MGFPVFFQGLVIVQILFLAFLRHSLIKRWHGNIDMSLLNKLRHKAVEQRQKQCGNVCTVHVSISHNNNLVIAQFCNIKIIAVALGKSTAKSIDHSLDFRICKDFVDACFLHVQNLTPDRQDCLIHTVSCCLCRSSGRISLHNKYLAF